MNQNLSKGTTIPGTALTTKHHKHPILSLVFEEKQEFWTMNSEGSLWSMSQPYQYVVRTTRSQNLGQLLGHSV